MRATLTRYLEALKKRRSSDEGFSLIELIVVVAVLGILVAIAIPVFGNIQTTAKLNSLETIAANAVTSAAAQFADGTAATPGAANVTSLEVAGEFTVAVVGTDLDDICATVTAVAGGPYDGIGPAEKGPGC